MCDKHLQLCVFAPDASSVDSAIWADASGDAGVIDGAAQDTRSRDLAAGDLGAADTTADASGSDGEILDGGEDASTEDAGVNQDPTVALRAGADPFVGSTTVTATVQDEDGDVVGCSFDWPALAGLSATSSGCTLTLVEAGLPRGTTITIGVTARDGRGGEAQAQLVITVGNHDPELTGPSSVSMWPDETVQFQLVDADGDTLSCSSSAEPRLEVSVSNVCVYSVSKADGVMPGWGASARIDLLADDGVGGTATIPVTIAFLDERGPHVSNLSSYPGASVLGRCGAVQRPCADIPTGLRMLRDILAEGAPVLPQLLIATTGSAYDLPQPVVTGDIDLLCRHDPASWQVSPAVTRTPLHFGGITGVHVTGMVTVSGCDIRGVAPPAEDPPVAWRAAVLSTNCSATVQDCGLLGNGAPNATSASYGLLATASRSAHHLRVQDSLVEGGLATTSAVGLAVSGGRVHLIASQAIGGQARSVVAVALATDDAVQAGPRSTVEGCTLLGGEGGDGSQHDDISIGLSIAGGAPQIVDNPSIAGGDANRHAPGINVGVWIEGTSDSDPPLLTGNAIHGVTGAAAALGAFGAVLSSGATLVDNELRGGHAGAVVGLAADSDPEATGITRAFLVQVSGGVVEGGEAYAHPGLGTSSPTSLGVSAVNLASVGLINVQVRTSAPADPLARAATGVLLDSGASVVIESGTQVTATGTLVSTGVHMISGAVSLTMDDCQVSAGPLDGTSDYVTGLEVGGGVVDLSQCQIRNLGTATNLSIGLFATSADVSMTIGPGTLIEAGPASASTGTSYGLLSMNARLGISGIAGSPVQILSGTAGPRSIAVRMQCDVPPSAGGAHSIAFLNASAAIATEAKGLWYHSSVGGCPALNIFDSTITTPADPSGNRMSTAVGVHVENATLALTRTTAESGAAYETSQGLLLVGGRVTSTDLVARSGASPHSAGAELIDPDPGSSFAGGTIEGGALAATSTATTSTGLHVNSAAEIHTLSLRSVNISSGDAAREGRGLWLESSAGAEALLMENCVVSSSGGKENSEAAWLPACRTCAIRDSAMVAGTTSSATGTSSGLWLDGPCTGCRIERNQIQAGSGVAGSSSVGLHVTGTGHFATGTPTSATYIVSNWIHGGTADACSGVQAQGPVGEGVRYLFNTIVGGGSTGSTQVMGVELQRSKDGSSLSRQDVGVFHANIVEVSLGDRRYGFWETCAENFAVEPTSATDNALWLPNQGTWSLRTHVLDAREEGNACSTFDVKETGVALLPGYAPTGTGDPSFIDSPHMHIDDNSTYANGIPSVDAWWPFALADLQDIDDQARSAPFSLGCDEVP
ncbi:MAG: hypothetical protein ABIJ09_09765 [Pseudomonadota bacterium]